ncbi:MAG: NFACT family protein, partial [Candidatus Nanohaloarchaeota archaeon QJJ-5]|nr:NFACT family protein [Candidatus Nanohaloarchaeota archaeon QJJ-5]
MRDQMTSLDLTAVTRELQVLEDARIDKIYQRDKDFTIHIYKPGDKKYRLFLKPGKAFLTRYKRDNPQQPPGFCMQLRKHLASQRIERVEQHGFDRVLMLHTDEYMLVAELFGQGNIVLVEKGTDTIVGCLDSQEWSDRSIYRGEQYKPPAQDIDPYEMAYGDFEAMLDSRQIVKLLAAGIGLGSTYAEEIMARTQIEKDHRSDKLADEKKKTVWETLQTVLAQAAEEPMDPRIYYDDNGDPADVSPFPLQRLDDHETTTFDTFSETLDTYFTQRQKAAYRKQKRKEYRRRKNELEHRKQQQEQMLEGMRDSIDEHKITADLIYEHYGTIESLIETLKQARKQYSIDEIRERLESEAAEGIPEAGIVEQLKLANDQVIVDLGEQNATIDLDRSVEKNAKKYYEKSKEAKRKVEGAEDALEETKRELEELKENKEEIDISDAFKDKEQQRQSKKWYEKFRWFFSSDGFLVVSGRDATTNDILVKKQMQPQDRYVHADFDGAPSVVIKNPDDEPLPDQTLQEAAQQAVTYSKAWEMNVAADDAYHVAPEQVTKDPESGEYLGKGAFVIRGDREYLRNVEASAAIGAYDRDGTLLPMGGPEPAIKANCDVYMTLKQGRTKKSDIAKQVQSFLHEQTGADFDLDKIMR